MCGAGWDEYAGGKRGGDIFRSEAFAGRRLRAKGRRCGAATAGIPLRGCRQNAIDRSVASSRAQASIETGGWLLAFELLLMDHRLLIGPGARLVASDLGRLCVGGISSRDGKKEGKHKNWLHGASPL